MAIREQIVLDLKNPSQFVNVRVQQGEHIDHQIEVTITLDGEIYDIPQNTNAYISMLKLENKPVFNPCIIENNTVTFNITKQMSRMAGRQAAQIEFINIATGGVIKTLKFHMLVEEAAVPEDMIVNTSELGALTDALVRVEDVAQTMGNNLVIVENANRAEQQRITNENKRIQDENARIQKENLRLDYFYVTKAQYDALALADKQNPKNVYEITDSEDDFPNELVELIDRTESAARVAEELVVHKAGINDITPTRTEAFSGQKVQTKFNELDAKNNEVVSQLRQKAEEEKVKELESRMNVFTSLPDGSTVLDSEIVDAHVANDGTIFTNIGDHIRTGFANVDKDISSNINIKEVWELGQVTTTTGIFSSDEKQMRTYNYLSQDILSVKTISGYVAIFGYEEGIYKGYYNGATYTTTNGSRWMKKINIARLRDENPTYDFILVARNKDMTNISLHTQYLDIIFKVSKDYHLHVEVSKLIETNNSGKKGSHIAYSSTAMKYGYDKFYNIAFENGTLISSSGENGLPETPNISVRSRKFTGNDIILIHNISPSKYRIKRFAFNLDGSFSSSTGWLTDRWLRYQLSENYVYRFQIATFGDEIDLSEALQHILFFNVNDKIESTESKWLRYSMTPMAYNSERLVATQWEMNGIVANSGQDMTTSDCMRTPLNCSILPTEKMYLLNNSKGKYRTRVFYYTKTNSYVSNSSWSFDEKIEINSSNDYYFRIVVATKASAIPLVIDDAQRFIGLVNESDYNTIPTTFIENGYLKVRGENTGITSYTIPNYWMDYLNQRIELIRNDYLKNGLNKTVFIAQTDTHFTGVGLQDVNCAIVKYLADNLNISTFMHLGDMVNHAYTGEEIKRDLSNLVRILKNSVNNFLPIRGNHDDNGYSMPFKDVITSSDSYSLVFRGLDVVFGATGTYYYQDNVFEKTRIICLDVNDFIYEANINGNIKEKILAYGYEQLRWVCDTLKSTPSGYTIILSNHTMLSDSIVTVENPTSSPQTFPKNYKILNDILYAYKNRTSINIVCESSFSQNPSYYSGVLNYDFSQCTGVICGIFSGHEHVDYINTIKTSSNTDTGITNVVMQNSSFMQPSNHITFPYQANMVIGTTTEHTLDVVVIDKVLKHVDLIRIGAGNHNVRSFEFA